MDDVEAWHKGKVTSGHVGKVLVARESLRARACLDTQL
jgi:hypothetical protein